MNATTPELSIYFLVNHSNDIIHEHSTTHLGNFGRNANNLAVSQLTALLQWIRRLARFTLATALWLNALFLLRFAPPRLSPLASRLHLNLGETTILVLIVSFSVLMSYGVKNLVVDALYIYFFPFVFVFLLIRLGYRICRIFIWKKPTLRTAQIVQKSSAEPQQQTVLVASPRAKQRVWERVLREIFRPFFQFTLLWALLLLLSSHRWLLWTALVIVLVHLVRALFRVSVLAVFSMKGLAQLEERIKSWAELQIARAIAASRQAEETQDVRQAWGAITGLQLGVKLLQNRQAVAQCIIFLSILVFGAIYMYIALLFSFAYYGLAGSQTSLTVGPTHSSRRFSYHFSSRIYRTISL